MTPEQRLDRLERIVKLFATAGRRVRSEVREHESEINHLINLQVLNEDLQKQNVLRFTKLAELQERTDRRLTALIDSIR